MTTHAINTTALLPSPPSTKTTTLIPKRTANWTALAPSSAQESRDSAITPKRSVEGEEKARKGRIMFEQDENSPSEAGPRNQGRTKTLHPLLGLLDVVWMSRDGAKTRKRENRSEDKVRLLRSVSQQASGREEPRRDADLGIG